MQRDLFLGCTRSGGGGGGGGGAVDEEHSVFLMMAAGGHFETGPFEAASACPASSFLSVSERLSKAPSSARANGRAAR